MSRIPYIEKITYSLLIGGFSLDHITTIIGINYFQLYETNPLVNSLINAGLWSVTDFAICVMFIFLLRKLVERDSRLQIVLLLPLFSGVLRIFVGISNLVLIL